MKRKPSAMKVPLDDLQDAAREFRKASLDTQATMDRLDEQVKRLQESWGDAGQQVFFQYYQEWQQYTSGSATLLKTIAQELEGIAERYADADRDLGA